MLLVWIYLLLITDTLRSTYGQAVYLEYYNSHVVGGRRKGISRSQLECVHACQSSLSCYAVDYDTRTRSCWFHGAIAICRRPLPRIGATHVKLVQCLNPAYSYAPNAGQSSVQFRGRHVIGGLFIGGISDVYHCIKSCTASCKAVDFDSGDNSCWHHVSPAVCTAPLAERTGSTHYRLPRCTTTAFPGLTKHSLPVTEAAVSTALIPFPAKHSLVRSVLSSLVPINKPRPLPLLINKPALPASHPVSCGQPAFSPISGRIVGGDTSRPHSWPWQVALRNRKSRSVRCAGSLIAPQLVLTTAHCVDEDLTGSNWLVYSGGHDLLQFEDTRTTHAVDDVILHEGFDLNTFDNDVALLKLTSPIAWSDYVSPVCLPPPMYELAPDTRCVITGWGVSEQGKRPLKQASIPIVAMPTCRRKDWLGAEFTLTSRMICAGFDFGGVDTCQGDSGGPLVCYVNSRWVQMGVTSFGRGCGLPQKPGVYSKVSHFVDWIQMKARLL